ncbi:MAG: hypothetical protein HY271_07020 [Deltaproteobacteria bacterium]|nr:hypothetical protein [Deltaproteobacteria bacterium]
MTPLHDRRFPGETDGYREARNALLPAKIDLRARLSELSRGDRQSLVLYS